jgi:NADH-quinone oxidoreductase subunit G
VARVGAIAGDLAGAEEMFALKALLQRLGIKNCDCRQDGGGLHPRLGRAGYLFNAGIEGIEAADAILLVGTNPRIEAAVLNARIRKRWRMGGLAVGVVGPRVPLTYDYAYLGAGPETLAEIAEGRGDFARVLKEAKRPMVVVGAGVASRPDGEGVLALAARIALVASAGKDVGAAAFNVLHTSAARVAGLDLGFVPADGGMGTGAMLAAAAKGGLDTLILLGADEIDTARLAGTFVVYIGSHGDAGAHRADVILPGAAYTEKSATYVNTEGRAQMTLKAVFPPGEAKEDWTILRQLSALVGQTLPFDTLSALRTAMYKETPSLMRIDAVEPAPMAGVEALAARGGAVGKEPFASVVADFYLTNPIARASMVMAEMSALRKAAGASVSAAE